MPDSKGKEVKTGRPTMYTDEMGDEIAGRLADGETLSSICEDKHLPNAKTVRRWLIQENHPFSPLYARARELGWMAMADEIRDISDDGHNDWMEKRYGEQTEWVVNQEALGRSRLRVDSRKWMLSKMLPKIYGDKVQNETTIGFTQEFEEFVRVLNEKRKAPKVIDAKPMAVDGRELGQVPTRVRN